MRHLSLVALRCGSISQSLSTVAPEFVRRSADVDAERPHDVTMPIRRIVSMNAYQADINLSRRFSFAKMEARQAVEAVVLTYRQK